MGYFSELNIYAAEHRLSDAEVEAKMHHDAAWATRHPDRKMSLAIDEADRPEQVAAIKAEIFTRIDALDSVTTSCLVCGLDIADCKYHGKHPHGEVVEQADGTFKASSQTSDRVYSQKITYGWVLCDCPAVKGCWHIAAVEAIVKQRWMLAKVFNADTMGYLTLVGEMTNRCKMGLEPTAEDVLQLRSFSVETVNAALGQIEMSDWRNSQIRTLWYRVLSAVWCHIVIFE